MFLSFPTGGSQRSQTAKSSYWWRGKYKISWFWISTSCIDPSQSLYTWSYYHVVPTTWNFTRSKGMSHTVRRYYYVTEIKLVLEIFHASRYMVIGLNIFWNDDKQSTIPRRFRNWSDFQNISRTRDAHIRNLARCWGAARLQRRFSSFQTSRTSQKGLFSNSFFATSSIDSNHVIQVTWFIWIRFENLIKIDKFKSKSWIDKWFNQLASRVSPLRPRQSNLCSQGVRTSLFQFVSFYPTYHIHNFHSRLNKNIYAAMKCPVIPVFDKSPRVSHLREQNVMEYWNSLLML